jgi:hypothetical protein
MCLPVKCGVIDSCYSSGTLPGVSIVKYLFPSQYLQGYLRTLSLSSMCLPVQCGVIDSGSGTGLRQVDKLAPVELQGLGG